MAQNILFPGQPSYNPSYVPVPVADPPAFQKFDYQEASYSQSSQPYYEPNSQNMNYDMQGGVTLSSIKRAFSTGGYDNEPPLLEELGVNFSHIGNKGITVLNPFRQIDRHIMDDTDLAAFGGFLLLAGKAHFGYIYGIAMVGVVCMYSILNLMSTTPVDAYQVASVLGLFGSAVAVVWSAYAASGIFTTVLEMKDQRLLVAYPVALFYSAFAIVTVF